MKVTRQSIQNKQSWPGYHVPDYDAGAIAQATKKQPQWLHFGPGNIFRIFPAVLCQRLIEAGRMSTGILCCESYDEQVVTRCLQPNENLTVAVTMHADGSFDKEIVASIADSLLLSRDEDELQRIFEASSLQMVSFTITEKGYAMSPAVQRDAENPPKESQTLLGKLTRLCIHRGRTCGRPLALVSMDNCSRNGEKLQSAVLKVLRAWREKGFITEQDEAYVSEKISFPWTMIDKITPRPDETIRRMLAEDGVEDLTIRSNVTGSVAAPFVNAEACEYLVIEDAFPAGRPPLEKGGVLFASRETVEKTERMKVCTCLNPLHTALAIFGCLLGYDRMSGEMKDPALVRLALSVGYQEGLPVVTHPGVLDPKQFLREVVTLRIPNPYLPDTPQRIATDTSQKLPVRFGETLKAWLARPDLSVRDLIWIPLVFAGWLRYLLAVDDAGNPFSPSPDPRLAQLSGILKDFHPGIRPDTDEICRKLSGLFADVSLWGLDLNACGLSRKVAENFGRMLAGPGAVRELLQKMRKLPAEGIPEDLRQN